MNQVSCFLLGIIVGAASLYVSMHYYVVQSGDGVHMISKLSPCLTNPYVDVRKFTAADWLKHRDLAVASMRAKNGRIAAEKEVSHSTGYVAAPSPTVGPIRPHHAIRISDNSKW